MPVAPAGCGAGSTSLIFRYRPLRGLARCHRYCTALSVCAVPVAAGSPAKRPVQAIEVFRPQPPP
ncbi:hypothetical protein C1X72_15020 [Pseudomonas sp. FW306-2-2C-D06B]|nr:hypothetical protein C1X72_15020 [Pseudomonas sp. FW306-2-2C-D06B]